MIKGDVADHRSELVSVWLVRSIILGSVVGLLLRFFYAAQLWAVAAGVAFVLIAEAFAALGACLRLDRISVCGPVIFGLVSAWALLLVAIVSFGLGPETLGFIAPGIVTYTVLVLVLFLVI